MSLLQLWVRTPAAHALGWTLFHSLWQGAVLALALAVALAVFRSSRVRYAAACVALAAMLAGFGFTFAVITARQQTPARIANGGGSVRALTDLQFRPMLLEPDSGITRVLPWLAPFWVAGVAIFHLSSIAGWLAARRLRARGVCSTPALWQDRLNRLGARLRVSRPVALLESCLADVPVVIGHLRPVILMPVGLLANLPGGQVEAILLHELAHVARYDYLVNLLQTAVEGLLFYHPAAWWISRVIRAERENCCDDLVVETSGDAYGYALALTRLEQNRSAALESALAATGGNLVKRIRRLLHQPEGPRAALTPVLSATILTVTAALALTAWQSKPADRPPMPSAPSAPSANPAVKLLAQAQVQPAPENPPAATPYRKWLDQDVVYIITEAERKAFLNLQTNEERKHFIEQFWLRRDPTPGTVENEYKEEHYRRIAYANEHFGTDTIPGWQTDRGRIYITYGPPDEIESHPSGGTYVRPPQEGGGSAVTYPFEDWRYRYIANVGANVIIEFVDETQSGDYRMTKDPNAKYEPPAAPQAEPAGVRQMMRVMEDLKTKASAKAGAAVQVQRDGALISIPLASFGGHPVTVYGLVVAQSGRVVQMFEGPFEGQSAAFTQSVKLAAGSYRLDVIVKDRTTLSVAAGSFEFAVK